VTESELWELILISQANAATYLAIVLTLISGYLVVAFIVGVRLTRSQIIIVNAIFTLFAFALVFATYAALGRAAFLLSFVSPEYASPLSAGINFAPFLLGGLSTAGVFACLKFMWDVRHPKTV